MFLSHIGEDRTWALSNFITLKGFMTFQCCYMQNQTRSKSLVYSNHKASYSQREIETETWRMRVRVRVKICLHFLYTSIAINKINGAEDSSPLRFTRIVINPCIAKLIQGVSDGLLHRKKSRDWSQDYKESRKNNISKLEWMNELEREKKKKPWELIYWSEC